MDGYAPIVYRCMVIFLLSLPDIDCFCGVGKRGYIFISQEQKGTLGLEEKEGDASY